MLTEKKIDVVIKSGLPFFTTLKFMVSISVGVICAAPIYNGWYRAQVVVSHVDCDEYDIKFVDYGGYVRMQGCQLRQIRYDLRGQGHMCP